MFTIEVTMVITESTTVYYHHLTLVSQQGPRIGVQRSMCPRATRASTAIGQPLRPHFGMTVLGFTKLSTA